MSKQWLLASGWVALLMVVGIGQVWGQPAPVKQPLPPLADELGLPKPDAPKPVVKKTDKPIKSAKPPSDIKMPALPGLIKKPATDDVPEDLKTDDPEPIAEEVAEHLHAWFQGEMQGDELYAGRTGVLDDAGGLDIPKDLRVYIARDGKIVARAKADERGYFQIKGLKVNTRYAMLVVSHRAVGLWGLYPRKKEPLGDQKGKINIKPANADEEPANGLQNAAPKPQPTQDPKKVGQRAGQPSLLRMVQAENPLNMPAGEIKAATAVPLEDFLALVDVLQRIQAAAPGAGAGTGSAGAGAGAGAAAVVPPIVPAVPIIPPSEPSTSFEP